MDSRFTTFIEYVGIRATLKQKSGDGILVKRDGEMKGWSAVAGIGFIGRI